MGEHFLCRIAIVDRAAHWHCRERLRGNCMSLWRRLIACGLSLYILIATLWGQAFWPAAALSGGVAQADSLRPMVNLLAMKPKLREANQRSPAGYQPAPQAQRESHALTAVELFVNRGAANAR